MTRRYKPRRPGPGPLALVDQLEEIDNSTGTLSTTEAAELLGTHRSGIHAAVRAGELRAVKYRGGLVGEYVVRLFAKDVERLAAERDVSPPREATG